MQKANASVDILGVIKTMGMKSEAKGIMTGFFFILDPPGGLGACPLLGPLPRGGGGSKIGPNGWCSRIFFGRFDTNTEEKHEKCLPSARPLGRGAKSLGAWAF